MQPTITSSRLRLRPFVANDAGGVRRLAGDKRIADMTLAVPHPYPEGAAEAWIATHPDSYEGGKEATFHFVWLLGATSI
jgi:[ribosomal protein S5]-alanine N-acetyltransferase